MIVVADISPLNYLVRLGEVWLLKELYGRVILPPAVLAELLHKGAPQAVREWASNLPEWVAISDDFELDASLPPVLGLGEREAISLAARLKATILLLDDSAGRKAAERRSLSTAGTLAVLILGAERGLVNLPEVGVRLAEMRFRMSEELRERLARG